MPVRYNEQQKIADFLSAIDKKIELVAQATRTSPHLQKRANSANVHLAFRHFCVPIQSEQILENNLVAQLETLGFEKVRIKDEADLIQNLKRQLEIHNKTSLSDKEFKSGIK